MRVAGRLLNAHSELLSAMLEAADIRPMAYEYIEKFMRLTDMVRTSGATVNGAWLAYVAHCKAHDCK